jgi:release factor glutamine methyltransferase
VTRGELLAELAQVLGAPHEARFILEEVTEGRPSSPAHVLDEGQVGAARAMAARREQGEPLQYIFGHWSFRTLDLVVDERVLIPRPETEQVVQVAVGEVERLGTAHPVMVDAGTGSGAIALSLAAELAGGEVWGIDASPNALAVARENSMRVHDQCGEALLPVTMVAGSWLDALPPALRGSVALIVANPPYVSEDEWGDLPPEVRREPRHALVAGPGRDGTPGMADVETLLEQSLAWLSRPGALVIEMAPHHTEAAAHLARALGYLEVRVEPDLSQRPRALVCRLE